MKNVVKGIVKIREGVWHISYDRTCDCGCKSTRYATTLNQKSEPAQSTAQRAADEHYSQQ